MGSQFQMSNPSLNDFQVEELLGTGCDGMVWKAKAKGFPRNTPSVALKMTCNYGTETRLIHTQSRFIQEFKILTRLRRVGSHRNVIHLLHQFTDRPNDQMIQDAHPSVREFLSHQDGSNRARSTSFYALEWHPHTVESLLNQRRLTDEELNQFSKDLLKGMMFLKKNGVVHMDMKLNNLLISQDHRLVIADFGVGISIDQNCRAAVGSISGNLE